MKCTNCGFENAEEARFCESCGANLAQAEVAQEAAPEAAQEAPKSKFDLAALLKNKSALIGIGIIAALIVLLIIVICAGAGKGADFIEIEQQYYATLNEDGDVVIISGKKVLDKTIEVEEPDKYYPSTKSSIDGKVMVLNVEDTLYVVRKNKITKVDDEIGSYRLSAWGDTIVYSVEDTEEDSEEYSYTYYYYTVKNGKSKEIVTTSSEDKNHLGDLILSPDGKSVAYSISEVDEDEEDGYKTTNYFFDGKKSTKMNTADLDLIAMSDKGKYIYAISEDEIDDEEESKYELNLYIYNKKGEKKAKLDTVADKDLIFNIDCTQVMYYTKNDNGDTYTYMSIKGKTPVKLAKAELSLIDSGIDAGYYYSGYSEILPVEDLYNHVYIGRTENSEGETKRDAFLVKKGEGKTVKLVSNITSYTLDDAAEYLYYMEADDDDNVLKVLKISKGENAKDKAVEIAEDVEDYVVTSDRKKVYFISDESLYSVNGKKGGKTKTIASDEVAGYLVISDKDIVYYQDSDGTVYATTGKTGKRVLDDASGFGKIGKDVYVIDEDDALYITNKKKAAKKLTETYVRKTAEDEYGY